MVNISFYKIKLVTILVIFVALIYFSSIKPTLLDDISFSKMVIDRNGSLMRLSLSQDQKYRIYIPIDKVPSKFRDIVLLYEDQYFYYHIGFNPISLFKAFIKTYIENNRKIGGSTITMQIVRMKYSINSSTIGGKLWQIIRAIHLELHYSKNEILAAYLKLIPYGGNIEGIAAASYIYLNRKVQDLNLFDSLNLALIPQNPVKRSPKGNELSQQYNKLYKARKYLFAKWIKSHPEDSIYSNLLDLAIEFKSIKDLPFSAPHFSLDILSKNNQDNIVHTTIDQDLQSSIEKQLKLYVNLLNEYGIKNGAALLVDFTTMEILASVGSANFFDYTIDGQINGTKMARSPGSTLKPFIYALAFDQSLIHPLTLLKDTPYYYGNYQPENFDNNFTGLISSRESLIKSRNVPVLFLTSKLTTPTFYEFLQQAKIKNLQKQETYGLSLALGTVEITMEELVTLYSMLANLGIYKPLKKIIYPQDKDDLIPFPRHD